VIFCQLFWEYTTNAPTLAQFVLFVNKFLMYSGRNGGFLSGGFNLCQSWPFVWPNKNVNNSWQYCWYNQKSKGL